MTRDRDYNVGSGEVDMCGGFVVLLFKGGPFWGPPIGVLRFYSIIKKYKCDGNSRADNWFRGIRLFRHR